MPNKNENESMPVATLVQLIIEVGLPIALKLADIWSKGEDVTPAILEELRVLSTKTPQQALSEVLTMAGIDPADPRAVALAALIKQP